MEITPDPQDTIAQASTPITPVSTKAPTSGFIKFIRIFLLILIVIGVGLLCTQNLWVPKVVNLLLGSQHNVSLASAENPSVITNNIQPPQSISTQSLPWIALSATNTIYSIKNNKIYVNTGDGPVEVAGADVATFVIPAYPATNQPMSYSYAKDKNTVYIRTLVDGMLNPVLGADPSTFVVVKANGLYDSEDKNHKYFAGGITCEDPTKKDCTLYEGPGSGNGHWYQSVGGASN